jgi:hypothetical protein
MPYLRKGKTIYKVVDGRLRKKATAKSVERAKKMLRLLNAIEHGFRPGKNR